MLPNPSHAPVLSRELLYTGITRARHRLTLIGQNVDEIGSTIHRKTRRSGRLGDLLIGQ
jgi:exodeoxyribonuclease V alpha subunit